MAEQPCVSFENAPLSPVHRKVRMGAFLGMLYDGYTLGIVGIALSYAADPLWLSRFWMGMIGSGALLGILFGGLISGPAADRAGRKKLFATVMMVSVFLSGLQFFITDLALLTLVRLLLGMAVGADYTVGISLFSEWTPLSHRPRAMGWLMVMWTVGYVLAYVVGYLMGGLGGVGWRWILCTSVVPGVVTLLVRVGVPESPGWLASKGRRQEALAVIRQYLGKEYGLPAAGENAPPAAWFRLFSKELRYNTLVSCVFFACQVLPFFGISIFLPIVLADLNIENPHASGVLYNTFTMTGTLVGTWLINKISRRAFLLWTFYGAAAILALLALWKNAPGPAALILLAVFSLILAISIVLEFCYPAELFPTELRASGVGLTVAMSRIGAAGGAFPLPMINEIFGVSASLGGCAAVLLLGGIVCHLWAPETSQRFIPRVPAGEAAPSAASW